MPVLFSDLTLFGVNPDIHQKFVCSRSILSCEKAVNVVAWQGAAGNTIDVRLEQTAAISGTVQNDYHYVIE
jgi:hypothetical protein